MTGIFDSIAEKYNYVIHDLADPRTAPWWGVSNPLVVISIVSGYLYFCKSLGPRLMENRKPFELKTTLLIYNIFQVLFSLLLVYWGAVYVLSKDYNLACDPIDYSDNPRALDTASSAWFYFFAKITELLDTVFFVLRKKYNQVSFLHVYHHTLMSIAVWMGVKYFPGGHATFMGFLNSIVHVIMYTYYLISSLGPKYQKYVWWKKHVTLIQLIQFSIIFVHNAAVFFYECDYPKVLNILCMVNSLAFMNMFGKFYINSYKKNEPEKNNKNMLETKKVTRISTKVKYDTRKKSIEKSR